jgi:hypothetical protein
MLGHGALGEFPLGGGPFGTATVATIGWYSPISEPVRFKRVPRAAVAVNNQTLAFSPLPVVSFGWFRLLTDPVRGQKLGLRAHEQQTTAFNTLPVVSFGWFEELSKPRTLEKKGIRPGLQQTLAFHPRPFVSFGWFGNLSDPVRIKRGLRPSLQQFFTTDTSAIPISKLIAWFDWLSDPVRVKPGLRASLQQFLASPSRLLPTPTVFGAMSADETPDTFLAGATAFNRPTSGELGVQERDRAGELGVSSQAAAITARMSIRTQ